MKVYGQLQVAQLEQIASTSPTPTPTGRVYADITSASAALPKFYNGTTWKQLAFEQTADIISQNSSTACTVDWSTGLNQQVNLTGHALISFSNPQTGKIHTLIVKQAASAVGTAQYLYKLNMTDQDTNTLSYQTPGVIRPNAAHVYGWMYKAAFRPKNTSNLNLGSITSSTLLTTASLGAAFHPSGSYLGMANATSPFQFFVPIWDSGVISPSFGLLNYKTPTVAVGASTDIAYTPDGMFCVLANGTTPFIQAFHLDSGVSSGTAISAPSALAGAAKCVDVHPQGAIVAVGHATTPFVSVLPLRTSGWQTKITNPVSLPAAQVNGVAFSPLGDYLAVASQTTPFLEVYNFTGLAGGEAFGSKLTSPVSLPTGGPAPIIGKPLAWRPQGDYIAMGTTVSPFLYVVPFNRATGAFGTPLTFGTGPAGAVNSVAWSPDGQFLVWGSTTSPFSGIYDFSSQTITTSIYAPVGAACSQVTIHPSGEYMVLAPTATPFLQASLMPNQAKNYLRVY